LAKIADTLSEAQTDGRLRQLCDRWIYSTCLIFGLNLAEQERSAFQYQYSTYQLEYSRNLRFHSGKQMWEVLQRLVDRTRARLDLQVVKTIFGFKCRPRVKRLQQNQWRVTEYRDAVMHGRSDSLISLSGTHIRGQNQRSVRSVGSGTARRSADLGRPATLLSELDRQPA
jgi:hypothetical protein